MCKIRFDSTDGNRGRLCPECRNIKKNQRILSADTKKQNKKQQQKNIKNIRRVTVRHHEAVSSSA